MTNPKFKTNDRVKWALGHTNEAIGAGDIIVGKLDASYGWKYKVTNGGDLWWHESHLSLDVPAEPKFKIGDRVKWVHFGKPSFGFVRARLSDGWWKVEYTAGCMENCHESCLSLDVQETHKFNIGDRVKWDQWGRIGVIVEAHADNRYSLETTWGCLAKVPGDQLVLDVPEPKQFATDLEAKLGAEIIKLHYDLAPLDARLNEEIGARHRERIAKEAVQKELAEANDMIGRFTKAQFDLSGQWRCERLAKESRQRELVEANDKIKRLKSLIGEM